jgi:hypothetical protein
MHCLYACQYALFEFSYILILYYIYLFIFWPVTHLEPTSARFGSKADLGTLERGRWKFPVFVAPECAPLRRSPCECVCVCVWIYVCICCSWVRALTKVSLWMCVCEYECMCIFVCVCMDICMCDSWVNARTGGCDVLMCVCVCMHVYICS